MSRRLPSADLEDAPPQNLDAERAVLSAVLGAKDGITEAAVVLQPTDFYRPAHGMIFAAALDLYSRGEPVEPVSVAAELTRRKELAKCGSADYLHTLQALPGLPAQVPYHGALIREAAILRDLAEAGAALAQGAYAQGTDPARLADLASAQILAATAGRSAEKVKLVAELLPGALDAIEDAGKRKGITGVPTGFADLDSLTDGLHAGQMVVIAARPAIGKSALALDFARNATIRHGIGTALFSLEMGRGELMARLLSAESGVPLNVLRSGQMTDDDWARLSKRTERVNDAPLFLDDTASQTLMEIRAKCRRLKQRHDLKMVIIDYLQLMSSPKRAENRQVEVSEISRGLKILAKDLEIVVVALSQLNRGPEQRQDKRPMLSDLRESGSIEQDADVVILLHREDAYERESPRAGEADLIVAKQRNGPVATVTVAFQGHYSRFVDMAPSHLSEAPEGSSQARHPQLPEPGQDPAYRAAG